MSATPKTTLARTRALADGHQIPLLGLGVWQVPNGPTTVNAARWALEGAQQRNIAVEAYSPLGTGRHLVQRHREANRSIPWSHPGAGAAALVPAA